MPCFKLCGIEFERIGQHGDAADGDDNEAYPHSQPVFLFPKVGDVIVCHNALVLVFYF
jgi:hypothetical protein